MDFASEPWQDYHILFKLQTLTYDFVTGNSAHYWETLKLFGPFSLAISAYVLIWMFFLVVKVVMKAIS